MGEAQAGAESKHTEGCCLLSAPPGLLKLSSYTAQDHLPKDGTDQSRLDLSHQINNQENDPRGLPTRDSKWGRFFLAVTPSSQVASACAKLMKEN